MTRPDRGSSEGARRTPDGVLYVIGTPIGNLEDLGLRARRLLGEVDLVLAEDTRTTAVLLRRFAVSTPLLALHEHNERSRIPEVAERIRNGASLALVSDAGTPVISDPGFLLVRALGDLGLRVVAVPGPSALVAAVSVCGIPSERFVFEGFLPGRAAARRARLSALADEPRSLVFYESPRRVAACIEDLALVFGAEREAAIARELTKINEEVVRGGLGDLAERLRRGDLVQRGEFVIVVAGARDAAAEGGEEDEERLERLLEALLSALPLRQAVDVAIRATGIKRNRVYALALRLTQDP